MKHVSVAANTHTESENNTIEYSEQSKAQH